jgi:Cu/Ag efflux pump CusA
VTDPNLTPEQKAAAEKEAADKAAADKVQAEKEAKEKADREAREKEFKPVNSQDEFDRMVQDRLRREREQVERETRESAEKEIREKIDRERKEEEAKKQGDFKALYEQSQKDIEELRKSIDTLKTERETETLAQIRTRIAEKVGIPAEMADRLMGKDEKEIEEDAKKVAKLVIAKPKGPDNEGGKPNRRTGPGNRSGVTHRFGAQTRVVKFPEKVPAKE